MKYIIPDGYESPAGYRGRLPNGRWMLFSSYSEYIEYLGENNND